ncbi:hypothetical protein SAMN06295974_1939 [Plantibacter flavus]|uniref:Uncharacterized protein n=1 Tax=Plantibacter flavus TaxID=150123 RepID=A0A1S7BDK4_9MICO|nr:hypothetical protein [Plantibacter flavus]AQX81785.1 hypothetical protein BWO91_19130 [Plantibacter flavus]ROR80044.1 hypothetical protein EDD42_0076 [Plantibacter flavus]SMG28982.1 hypothetical protein SAMN06295974_1939 [Plantibacter flavus]
MGKASRIKRERGSVITATHEPKVPQNWPDGHVGVELTGSDDAECIVVTIHGVRHYLHSSTAYELSKMLDSRIEEWDSYAKSQGAPGVLDVD